MPDLDGICVRKEMVGGRLVLVPGDEHAAETIAKLTDKKDVMVRISTPRNPQHHKFVFAYFKKVIEQTDGIWQDTDELLDAVKFAVGHTSRFRRILNPHADDMELANEIASETLYVRVEGKGLNLGKVRFEPLASAKKAKIIMALRRGADEYVTRTKSIAYESMGEERFREFHDKTVEALNAFLGWDTSVLMEKKNDAP